MSSEDRVKQSPMSRWRTLVILALLTGLCAVSGLLFSVFVAMTDNTLWNGKVADTRVTDAATQAIRSFNQAVFSRTDLESLIIPLRDGLTVCRKK